MPSWVGKQPGPYGFEVAFVPMEFVEGIFVSLTVAGMVCPAVELVESGGVFTPDCCPQPARAANASAVMVRMMFLVFIELVD